MKSEKKRVLRTDRIIYNNVGTGLAPVRNPQKLVATASRREGVYNRTGEPSVIFAEKEELRTIRSKRRHTVGTGLAVVRKSAKVGSDSEPLRGRLQPNRQAERDFCGKGGVA